jgi:hypothetical protein
LFLLSVRYIPLSSEWAADEAYAWWRASEFLGVRDPEDLYIGVWLSVELIVAVLAYVAITRLWRRYRTKQ